MQEEMIKGEDPRNKKETFKDWLKYFCSKHHWNRGELFSQIMDKEGDGFAKPTLKLFLYNVWHELFYEKLFRPRMFISRFFNPGFLSDCDIWEGGYTMSKFCLKVIKAYKKSPRHGYPGYFSEKEDWEKQENYDKQIAEGKRAGGGAAEWERVIDHIIMSLEYYVHEGDWKWMHNNWWLPHFGIDPHDETNECNKYVKYEYRYKDDPPNIGCHMSFNEYPERPDDCEYIKKSIGYGNSELQDYAETIVQQGYELLGKFMRNFWD